MRKPGPSILGSALLCVMFVAVVSALVALPAEATAPGRNAAIVFQHVGHYLWVVNSDGTGERQLTKFKGAEDANPDWSPDGSLIAFDRCSSHCEIWTVKADGTGARRVGPDCLHRTGACTDRAVPAWAPNGKEIASGFGWGPVKSDNHAYNEIVVMNARSGAVRKITHITTSKPFSVDVNKPMWSPSGAQIAFEVRKLSPVGAPLNELALFVVNADGSSLHQLTPWDLNGGDRPDWSPDGKRILFRAVSTRNEQHGNLYTVHPDGKGLKQLTNYPEPKVVSSGSFSPDGKWITFSRFTTSSYPDIFVMRANGTAVRQVSRKGVDVQPDWGSAQRH